MTRWFQLKPVWLSATLFCALSAPAMAGLITNGGFESGFSSWTRTDQLGSEGTFALQTGTTSPVNGDPVPAPPGGTTAAMTDAQGPGSHVLSQSFTVSAPVLAAMLRFDIFVGNRAGMFVSPSTLDFSTPALNQQARVDILVGSAGAFSVLPADVLLNAFQTNPGDPLVSGYTHHTVDVTTLINYPSGNAADAPLCGGGQRIHAPIGSGQRGHRCRGGARAFVLAAGIRSVIGNWVGPAPFGALTS